MKKYKIAGIGLIGIFLCWVATVGAQSPNPKILMETSRGPIVLELDAAAAPKTVANFIAYATDGHYNGTIFHRVIPGFMIQGGDPTAEMTQKPTQSPVANEADNGLKNLTGTIAMARTSDPHSATSQFFVNTVDNAFLNHSAKTARGWGYCVFGKVVEGMETVAVIEKSPTTMRNGHQDVPVAPIVIERVTVLESTAAK